MYDYIYIIYIGEEVNLSECLDPHTVAGLLKLHFREQRQCIIPGDALIHKIALAVEGRDVSDHGLYQITTCNNMSVGIKLLTVNFCAF